MPREPRKGFHHRNLRTSVQLQRVYDLLEANKEKTTLEIILEGRVGVASTTVSELRRNGCDIRCRRRDDGCRAYRMHRGVPWRKNGENIDERSINE